LDGGLHPFADALILYYAFTGDGGFTLGGIRAALGWENVRVLLVPFALALLHDVTVPAFRLPGGLTCFRG
jgi:hypothetical protein